jgi:hypothetical protein
MIDIETAKRAAAYLEKVRNRRRFHIYKEDAGRGPQLNDVIEYFVGVFKPPRYSHLRRQFTDELGERGFDFHRVQELYDAACEKHGMPTFEVNTDPDVPTNWPDGFYSGGLCEVFLLEGTKSIRIGRWIEARANVVDESNRHVGILVRFLGDDSKWTEHVIELDHLSSDGSKMFQSLEEAGHRIAGERKARAALRQLIQDSDIATRDEAIVRYSRPGWHGDEFVLPTGVTARGNKASVAGGVRAEYGGTYAEWCEHVRDQIWTGDTPQFAIGMLAGFAGIISSRLDCDHPIIYFKGPTGSGKTTSQIIGAGTVADPNGGRGTLFEVADEIKINRGLGTCVHIDDPTKRPTFASAKKIESLIYGVHGRAAATISSVASLERLIEKAKGTMSEGVRRRVLTIDTENIPRIEIGRADAIKSAAKRYYGHAAVIFATQVGDVDDLQDRVLGCVRLFVGETNDPELYGIARIAGMLLAAAQIACNCDLVPERGAAQVFPALKEAVDDWIARRREGSGLAVIEGLVSEARPLGECPESLVWIGQERDGEGGGARVLYVRTDRLDRGQVRQIKAAGKLLELNDNNTAHNYLPRPDGRYLRHYRVRSMAAGQPS